MKEAGVSLREIANRVCRNVSTVSRCWSRWSEEGSHERRRGSGRPRSTTDREERHLRTLAVRDRLSTSRALGNVWVEAIGRRLYGIRLSPKKVFWTSLGSDQTVS